MMQYYIGEDDLMEKKPRPEFKLEYLTHSLETLHPGDGENEDGYAYPIPLEHLPRSLREKNVTKSKYAPYEMQDLTIPSWVELAQRLTDAGEKKLRKRFRKYMYMGDV